MWQKIINTLFPSRSSQQNNHAEAEKSKLQEIPLIELPFSLKAISKEAFKTVGTLQKNKFQGLIVGGAVRDLIAAKTPKDFDIATDATPEEVKKLFRRALIIGRRFPIVHVHQNHHVLEVSTFRKESKFLDEAGRIVRDNIYGSLEEDAKRRDFTCNALYLDPYKKIVYAFPGAIKDLKDKRLVMIGDADIRLKEDPIRIVRGLRIAGKLGLSLSAALQESMRRAAPLLKNEPPSRLFDEWAKIIYSGKSRIIFASLEAMGLLPFVHPIMEEIAAYPENDHVLIGATLAQTDERIQKDKGVSLGFVTAALLWPLVYHLWQEKKRQGLKSPHALNDAINEVLTSKRAQWEIPNRLFASINAIWRTQHRLENARSHRQVEKLRHQPRFRAAYDFLLLRAKANNTNAEKAKWWQETVMKECNNG